MKKLVIFGFLVAMLVLMPLLSACEMETTSTPAGTETPTATTTPTASADTNWWDSFGEPQYGGKISIAIGPTSPAFDVYSFRGEIADLWYDAMFEPDWTLDREIWNMTTSFVPDQYWTGNLVESWEQPDLQTIIVHLRQGITWQDKEPVNGREFTAYDVQAHYDRILGTGDYTEGSPIYSGTVTEWERVTATDDYTVVYKFKSPGGQWFQTITERWTLSQIEAPEWVAMDEAYRSDWHNAVGTGPWMLSNFVDGSSFSFVRNPNYWGYDERYPENQLPYADELSLLMITDLSTRTAALRTGQIDILGAAGGLTGIDWQQMESITNTNPEMSYQKIASDSFGVTMRFDKAPFTDIRVRKALNMAINREEINDGYYGGTGLGLPCGLISTAYTGFAFAYEDWPQELKDEYAYNPEKAKELLAEAAADGVFEPNDLGGFDTNVICSTSGDTQLVQVFKGYFAEIGIDMEIQAMDNTTYDSMRRATQHDQLCTSAGGLTWPPSRAVPQYYSQGPDASITMVNDPYYDELRNQFFTTSDPLEVARITQEADRYAIEQHWQVTAGEYYTYNIWQPYLKGYSGEQLGWGWSAMLARLWVDQD